MAIQNYERYYNDHQLDNYNNYNKRQKYIPKKYKRKRRYQKTYNSSSSETKDEEIIVPRRKKRRQKKVCYDEDVDGDASKAYAYYDPTSPTDDDDDDHNVDDNEKTNVKTLKIIRKPTKKQKRHNQINKSIKN